jgi:hypothetical protein
MDLLEPEDGRQLERLRPPRFVVMGMRMRDIDDGGRLLSSGGPGRR